METIVLALMVCLVMQSFPTETAPIPLSMMDQSVDDMYDGCSDAMAEKVKKTYFPREMKSKELFKKAWEQEEKTAQTKYDKSDKKLTKEQIQALLVYSGQAPLVYGPFNKAVRESKAEYTTTTFTYHALHYWLTTTLQKLKPKKCLTTYRRSNLTFTGELKQEMRFGQFASSSDKPNLKEFGNETCFQIETCFGAFIKDYSLYLKEDEVLIPPYEKFNILQKAKDSYEKLENCENIFVLKSTGSQSNLNCKAA